MSPFFTLSFHLRIGRLFHLQSWFFFWWQTLVAFPYFLYMLVKITGKQKEGWKVFQKSKGRQELHSGLLWIQTIFHLKIFFFASAEVRTRKDFTLSPTSSVAYFQSLLQKHASCGYRDWRQRSEKLRCPCFNDRWGPNLFNSSHCSTQKGL